MCVLAEDFPIGKKWLGFLPSVWFAEHNSGPPSRISLDLPCPAKTTGEDVTVVIQGSEGFPEVGIACRQRWYVTVVFQGSGGVPKVDTASRQSKGLLRIEPEDCGGMSRRSQPLSTPAASCSSSRCDSVLLHQKSTGRDN